MSFDRRSLLLGALASAAMVPAGSRPALSRAAPAGVQVPGLYRFNVGSIEVTALNDGMLGLELDLYPSAGRGEAERLLDQAFLPRKGIPTAVNAYLVNTGERLVLVDAGAPAGFAPTLGKLPATLRAAGIDPSAVDAVVLTHLHGDHVGALTAAGGAAFPNAELVVAEPEFAFWMDEGALSRAPAEMKAFFEMARGAVQPYLAANRVRRVQAGTEVVPGIRVEAAPGHTPGHAMIRVSSGQDTLLIWGDVVHTPALQFARPEWAFGFDVDQPKAVETRRRVFDQAAADRTLVAGMHIPFPGIGHVAREAQGYRFVPAFWSPQL
jgi:glyoxylase-like metal-dependent hydrolase (beta-lactamase superfamily II)